MPHRSGRPLAWALLALLALPAVVAAGACGDCGACPMAAQRAASRCHPPAAAQMEADCCSDLAPPTAPASARRAPATQVATDHPLPAAAAAAEWPAPPPASLRPATGGITPPLHALRLHSLLSVYRN